MSIQKTIYLRKWISRTFSHKNEKISNSFQLIYFYYQFSDLHKESYQYKLIKYIFNLTKITL